MKNYYKGKKLKILFGITFIAIGVLIIVLAFIVNGSAVSAVGRCLHNGTVDFSNIPEAVAYVNSSVHSDEFSAKIALLSIMTVVGLSLDAAGISLLIDPKEAEN